VKGVLMVAYHYPPDGGSSGVLRALKFSKYLPSHGWRPHVLTLRGDHYPMRDEGLLRDVPPEVTVHRTRGWDTARHLAIRGRHLAAMAVPDRFVSWLPFAVARGLAVIRRSGIAAIYSTSPPPTAHLVALALKRLTDLPWIADFRDPWIEDGLYPAPGSLRFAIESRLERAVALGADRLVATTAYLRGDFLARYPGLRADHARVVHNGYDEADFSDLAPAVKTDRLEILHAGLVTPEFRDPAPLLEAIAALIEAARLPRAEIRVTLLGGGEHPASAAFAATVRRLALEDVVAVEARVPNHESIRRLRQASCLLLMQASDDTRSLIPAKAFEYLRVGRPILALIHDGATADLLKEMSGCVVVDPRDSRRLQDVVQGLHDEWRATPGPVVAGGRPVQRFERAALTGELARLLDEVTEEGRHG
jgi:glycosyltransferase involved in cell wall biosynthesis